MGDYHSTGEIILGGIAALILGTFIYAVLQVIDRIFRGKPQQEMQPDLIAESLRVVSTPMQLPGGRWGHYETKLVECAPPMASNNLEVHDVRDPAHNPKTCKTCLQRPNYSGVSYRAS